MDQREYPTNIKFHDVSLRDGEQQSGLIFNKDQKVALAEKLAEVGIHRMKPPSKKSLKEIWDLIYLHLQDV